MRALLTGVMRGRGRALVVHLVAGGWEVAAVGAGPTRSSRSRSPGDRR